jgi:hypothetical protein
MYIISSEDEEKLCIHSYSLFCRKKRRIEREERGMMAATQAFKSWISLEREKRMK